MSRRPSTRVQVACLAQLLQVIWYQALRQQHRVPLLQLVMCAESLRKLNCMMKMKLEKKSHLRHGTGMSMINCWTVTSQNTRFPRWTRSKEDFPMRMQDPLKLALKSWPTWTNRPCTRNWKDWDNWKSSVMFKLEWTFPKLCIWTRSWSEIGVSGKEFGQEGQEW